MNILVGGSRIFGTRSPWKGSSLLPEEALVMSRPRWQQLWRVLGVLFLGYLFRAVVVSLHSRKHHFFRHMKKCRPFDHIQKDMNTAVIV